MTRGILIFPNIQRVQIIFSYNCEFFAKNPKNPQINWNYLRDFFINSADNFVRIANSCYFSHFASGETPPCPEIIEKLQLEAECLHCFPLPIA